MRHLIWPILLILLLATACRDRTGLDDLPTPAEINALATERVLTQNAPPPGYRDSINFAQIDSGLSSLPGWYYTVQMEFEGVFARTPRTTSASTRAEVWYNQLGSAWRVAVEASGELLGQTEDTSYEGVRMGPDTFLVVDGVCQSNADEAAETVANLNAGNLIGGVTHATPAARRATINGEEVWRYVFEPDTLILPNILPAEDGEIIFISGELWFAPEHDAVIRFYVNLDVENVLIFGSQLPVSGTVILRYDLFDIGIVPNISVPFGC